MAIGVQDESDRSATERGHGRLDFPVELAELAVNEQDTIRPGGNSDVAADWATRTLEQINAPGDLDGLDLSLTEILGAGPPRQSNTDKTNETETDSF
jgi:hypothetical protein